MSGGQNALKGIGSATVSFLLVSLTPGGGESLKNVVRMMQKYDEFDRYSQA